MQGARVYDEAEGSAPPAFAICNGGAEEEEWSGDKVG
jgi:hypothetical protein